MKFIADVMLGRLAKKLRLMGFDVLYYHDLGDDDIIRFSLDQDRVILTRDTALAARPLAASHMLIESDHVGKQVRQVLSSLPAGPRPSPLTRCSECNEPLSPVPREEVRDLVADRVYETHSLFLRCAACGRIYWRGTHTLRMETDKR